MHDILTKPKKNFCYFQTVCSLRNFAAQETKPRHALIWELEIFYQSNWLARYIVMLDLFISVLRTDWFVWEEFVGTLPSPRTLQLPTLPYPSHAFLVRKYMLYSNNFTIVSILN